MSYSRFTEAPVYVYLSGSGLECCMCCISPRTVTFPTTAEMLAHLDAHRAAGYDIPDWLYNDLRADAEENDHYVTTGEWLR